MRSRPVVVRVRLSEAELQWYRAAAGRAEVSLSEWIRRSLEDVARVEAAVDHVERVRREQVVSVAFPLRGREGE